MRKKLSIILVFLLIVSVIPSVAKINGPTATFQIRWYVYNSQETVCSLKLLDFATQRELADMSSVDLVYTAAWQGLCTYEFKTNAIINNGELILHGFTLKATPLINTADASDTLPYFIKAQWGWNTKFLYSNGTWIYSEEEPVEWTMEVDDPDENSVYKSSGPHNMTVRHPEDLNRKMVTIYIPISIMLPDSTLDAARGGSTYVTQILLEVSSP